jgi:hypothetical protein
VSIGWESREEVEHVEAQATLVKRSGAFDADLALVLLLVIGLNLPYLAHRVVPIHDTFYNFASFHIFYSEFFFHGDLASWYPYGTYGLQSDYEQIISLSPSSYLVGLVGGLLRIPDALLLFKLAAIGDQIALVLGVYLLSRRLFATRATKLALCVAAAASSVWYAQQWWDLRIYYLLPLVLYFFVSFLESRRPEQLWFAGIAGVAWAVGFLPYVVPLWLLVLLVVALVATAGRYRDTAALLLSASRANLLALGLFVAASSIYAYFVLHALDYTILHAPDRNPITGKVDLETFLTYGGNADLVTVANALLFGWPLQLPWGSGADNSVYIGLLPLLGFGVAVARERSRTFLGLAAAIIFLVLLSYGGAFTRIAYYLPGLAYYRHVALVYGIVKVLMLVASGYGLERLWARAPPRFSNPVLAVVAIALFVEALAALASLSGPRPWQWLADGGSHVLVRASIYAAAVAVSQIFSICWKRALVVGLALDLMLFQFAVYQLRVPKLAPRDLGMLEAVQVRDPYYQPDRRDRPIEPALPATRIPANEQSETALELATRPNEMGIYWYIYQFSNFDPCRGEYRTDFLPIGVDRLLSLQRKTGLDLDRTLGCRVPKLELVSGVRIVDSLQEAQRSLVAEARAGGRTPVIQLAAGSSAPPDPVDRAVAAGRVEVTHFKLGELRADVQVDGPSGAWLIYADAYHPDWHASVNGQQTPVHQANLAFKAVWLPPGSSQVRFWFHHGLNHSLSYGIALIGVASALALLALLVATLLGLQGRSRSRS